VVRGISAPLSGSIQEIAAATQIYELSPAVAIGMLIGADIAPTDPAVIRARDMRAKVAGGLDLAAAPSGEPHAECGGGPGICG
jgi:hypothetical protein